MTSYDVVELVLLIEIVVLALALIAIFWAAFSTRAAYRRRAPMLERGRAILYGGLQRGALSAEDSAVLASFPRSTQIRLFADLAPNLVGEDREWLGDVAERSGLISYARRRCKSRLWWQRLNAARLLTLFARIETSMLELTRDRHPLVRAQAAEALGLRHSPAGIDALIRLLADKDPFVRFMARDSLIRVGRPAHQAIADHISNPQDPALPALLSVAATSPSHMFSHGVMKLVNDPRAEIRACAADTLSAIGGSEASAQLAKMLDDPAPEVRLRAIAGIASVGFWPAAPAVARLLEAPEWQVRYRAALALQNLGGPGELLLRKASNTESIGTPIVRRVLDAAAQLRLEGAAR